MKLPETDFLLFSYESTKNVLLHIDHMISQMLPIIR